MTTAQRRCCGLAMKILSAGRSARQRLYPGLASWHYVAREGAAGGC